MKVVGIQHAVGTFEDKNTSRKFNYDNYNIFCTDEENPGNVDASYGVCPKVYKVKAAILHQVVSPDKVQKLIDRSVFFWYDANKRIAKVDVL